MVRPRWFADLIALGLGVGCVMLTPSRSLRFSGEFMAGRLAVQGLQCSLLKQMCMEFVRSVATFHRAAYFTVGAVLCCAVLVVVRHTQRPAGPATPVRGGRGPAWSVKKFLGVLPARPPVTGHGTAVRLREDPLVSGQCLEGRMS